MIRRGAPPEDDHSDSPRGFDDFDLKLGDVLRGERATLGKSLLDVQRELKIKANYIAAIESADASAFETPGFIAGYVRSYSRYLGLDPEWAYKKFCEESDFGGAQSLGAGQSRSPSATATRMSTPTRSGSSGGAAIGRSRDQVATDPLMNPRAPFSPTARSGGVGRIEPGALGSVAVLLALIAGLGYGGWTVLQQVQRVSLVPVDEAPGVVAELDPLAGVTADEELSIAAGSGDRAEALDRLYRPKALDVPVMVARDGPIASLDPDRVGLLPPPTSMERPEDLLQGEVYGPVMADADALDAKADAKARAELAEEPEVQVVAADVPEVELFAVRPAWVRVTGPNGTVLFEKILDAGERYTVPKTEGPPLLRAGNSGSVYFAVNGQTYGPAGPGTSVAKKVPLAVDELKQAYQVADLDSDPALRKVVEVAQANQAATGQ